MNTTGKASFQTIRNIGGNKGGNTNLFLWLFSESNFISGQLDTDKLYATLLWSFLEGNYVQHPILPGHIKGEQGKTLECFQKAVIIATEWNQR